MARINTVQPTCELGRRLEAKREELGFGVEEMAEHMEVSKPAYHGWLRGSRPTAKENIKRVMEVLEIDLIEFWELTPDHVHSLIVPLSGRTVDYRTIPTVRAHETTDRDYRPIDIYADIGTLDDAA